MDTSALVRVLLRQNTTEWDDRIGAGLVAICDLTELEVLHSARSTADRTRSKAALDAHHAWCPMPDGVYHRSRIVQEHLTAKGRPGPFQFGQFPSARTSPSRPGAGAIRLLEAVVESGRQSRPEAFRTPNAEPADGGRRTPLKPRVPNTSPRS
ncbi:hypothetical protein [Streptomyces humidus]|uniref:hypothetical protein n=1 Tax=Streptomyces humidus TaxID=52259 RepID=UPI003D9F1E7E